MALSKLELVLYDGLGQLPLFNPDCEIEPLQDAITAMRRAVGNSAAL